MTTRACLLQDVKTNQWVRKALQPPACSHSLTNLLGILGKECHSEPATGLPRAVTVNMQLMIKAPRKHCLPFPQVTPGQCLPRTWQAEGSWPSVSYLSLYSHFAARINSPCFCSHAVVQWIMSSSLGLQDSDQKHLNSMGRVPLSLLSEHFHLISKLQRSQLFTPEFYLISYIFCCLMIIPSLS